MSKKRSIPRRADGNEQLGYTDDMETAFGAFTAPVQCGGCYQWYDAAEGGSCPLCDSDEVVGDR